MLRRPSCRSHVGPVIGYLLGNLSVSLIYLRQIFCFHILAIYRPERWLDSSEHRVHNWCDERGGDHQFIPNIYKTVRTFTISAPIRAQYHHYRLYRLVGRLFTNVRSQLKRATKHLAPIIQDRRRHIEEYGSYWEDKPVRLLTSWSRSTQRTGHFFIDRSICCLG